MSFPGNCFRCGEYGHAMDGECPLLQPAKDYAEHIARIDGWRDRWIAGGITEWQKREFITAENKTWNSRKTQRKSA